MTCKDRTHHPLPLGYAWGGHGQHLGDVTTTSDQKNALLIGSALAGQHSSAEKQMNGSSQLAGLQHMHSDLAADWPGLLKFDTSGSLINRLHVVNTCIQATHDIFCAEVWGRGIYQSEVRVSQWPCQPQVCYISDRSPSGFKMRFVPQSEPGHSLKNVWSSKPMGYLISGLPNRLTQLV